METYKAGQGGLARLTTWMAVIISLSLGCRELYSWIYAKTDRSLIPLDFFQDLPLVGGPLSYKVLLCTVVFVGLLWLIRRYLLRPQTVDALIETELELKKVSWPTRDESMNATWVVVLVTVLLTVTLSMFDGVLGAIFRMIF
ncbi:MAG: preprotein translocase subunit SecE [Planctomycetota bacterium]|jgi:preprotein translocase SecE subunit